MIKTKMKPLQRNTEAIWGILIEVLGFWVLLMSIPDNFQSIKYFHKL